MNFDVTIHFPEVERLVQILMSMAGRLLNLETSLEKLMTIDSAMLDLITKLNDRTNAIAASVDSVVASETAIKDTVTQIVTETQQVSDRIDALVNQIKVGMSPEEVASVKAQLQAVSDAADAAGAKLTDQAAALADTSSALSSESATLTALGQDPANPVPPVEPPPADGSTPTS